MNFKELEQVKLTDILCPIHDVFLITFRGDKAFCQECAKERAEKRSLAVEKETLTRELKRKTVDVLSKDSVFSDDTLKYASFDSYQTKRGTESDRAKDFALTKAREYYSGNIFTTVFSGDCGVGKSHLSMSILKVLNDNNDNKHSCLFISFSNYLRRIRNSFNDNSEFLTEEHAVRLAGKADFLVLDDIGSDVGAITTNTFASDFTVKTLNDILEARQNKATIITTNLTNKQIKKIYGGRIYSRIFRGAKENIFVFTETKDKRLEG